MSEENKGRQLNVWLPKEVGYKLDMLVQRENIRTGYKLKVVDIVRNLIEKAFEAAEQESRKEQHG